MLAACTDTSTHSWTCARVHARSPCCCTPWPGWTLAHAAHTHPVTGTRTPSLPGRAVLSPRPQFLFMVMEPPAWPPLHQEGWPGWGAPPCPAAWPRCCPCALCWILDPGSRCHLGRWSSFLAGGHVGLRAPPTDVGPRLYSGKSGRKSWWECEPDPVCHRCCHHKGAAGHRVLGRPRSSPSIARASSVLPRVLPRLPAAGPCCAHFPARGNRGRGGSDVYRVGVSQWELRIDGGIQPWAGPTAPHSPAPSRAAGLSSPVLPVGKLRQRRGK